MLKPRLNQLMLEWSARNGRRLTMRELSETTGLALAALTRYKGDSVDRVYVDTVNALCKFFECGLCDLLEYQPEASQETAGLAHHNDG